MQSTYLEEIQAEFDKKSFIEDIGMIFRDSGQPRMAGKIFGSLLICDPPYQSSNELIANTGGSKASISTMTRMLIQIGLIERTGIPGKKGIYYKLRDDSYAELFLRKVTFIKAFKSTLEKGMGLITAPDKERYNKLKELSDLYTFFEDKFPMLIEMWKKEREQNGYK
jgi:DNA-binding transcriptional regulator GbsR (MarR family)